MASITKAGHAQGCIVAFDLAHAAGNIPMELHAWDVDFAAWCNYKYLNGGPGCIAGCFVHERYATDSSLPRFAGWWGNDDATRFKMGPDFDPIAGAEGWQQSNPSVLSMAALRASLEIFDEATIERLREKSISLTGYLEFLLDANASDRFTILTPRDASQRGAQLSIRIASGRRSICDRLIANGVLCDWREPDILRIAPAPLYNSYQDVHQCVQKFLALLD
jgi:kynureninase